MLKKKSFFEKLTGGIRLNDEEKEQDSSSPENNKKQFMADFKKTPNEKTVTKSVRRSSQDDENDEKNISELVEEEEDGQLTLDVYQTPTEIVIQTMVAGVQPENLSISISRDMVTIRGKREENRSINEDNYFLQELYWGSFSRTISLPEEVDPEEAEAIEKHGLLIIKLPKINKEKKTNLKVRSI